MELLDQLPQNTTELVTCCFLSCH